MGFLTFSALIELRVTVSGVYDVKQGKIVFDAINTLFSIDIESALKKGYHYSAP